MAMREQQKIIDRSKNDVINRENMEVKMLEKEVGDKDMKISELKNQLHSKELEFMSSQSRLRDEIDLLKEKNNKLI